MQQQLTDYVASIHKYVAGVHINCYETGNPNYEEGIHSN